jgi:hypothetical protein
MKYLIAGAVATAIIPRLDAQAKRRRAEAAAAAGRPPDPPKPKPGETRRVINVQLDRVEAIDRALGAIRALRRVQVRSVDQDGGKISAVTGPTLKSMGENIEVSLAQQENGRLQIEIASLSKLFAVTADREKNEENVRLIAEAIQLG